MSQRCARIPQLDGLRAISISLVIFAHLFNSAGVSLPVSWFRWQMFSGLGVRVFFVISGFLITGLLLREKEECGSISLLRFYGRRTFRILVPYYVFLAVLIVAQALHLVRFTGNDLLHALTYTTNYQTDRSWVTGHCWSLAVEEQFYLLWPLAMVLLGKRRAALAALGMLFLAPVMRSFIWKFVPAMHPVLGISFETVADALAAGCLLACAREKLWAPEIPGYHLHWMMGTPERLAQAEAAGYVFVVDVARPPGGDGDFSLRRLPQHFVHGWLLADESGRGPDHRLDSALPPEVDGARSLAAAARVRGIDQLLALPLAATVPRARRSAGPPAQSGGRPGRGCTGALRGRETLARAARARRGVGALAVPAAAPAIANCHAGAGRASARSSVTTGAALSGWFP